MGYFVLLSELPFVAFTFTNYTLHGIKSLLDHKYRTFIDLDNYKGFKVMKS